MGLYRWLGIYGVEQHDLLIKIVIVISNAILKKLTFFVAGSALTYSIRPLRFGRPEFESRLMDLSDPAPLSLTLRFLSTDWPIKIKVVNAQKNVLSVWL